MKCPDCRKNVGSGVYMHMKHVHGKVYGKKGTVKPVSAPEPGPVPVSAAVPKPNVLNNTDLFPDQNEFLKLARIQVAATYIAFNVFCLVGISYTIPARSN